MADAPLIADYDTTRVVQAIGDLVPQAYAAGTKIRITPSGPFFTRQVGQHGHEVRVKSRAVTHTVMFSLLKSDPVNDKLSEQLAKDIDESDGSGIVDYHLTDNNGTTKATGKCWIEGYPEITYSDAGDVYEWTLALKGKVHAGSLTAV